jgi:hypothetical protein
MSVASSGLEFCGDMVSSTRRATRAGGSGKPRGPILMRELIRTGRWPNGDRLSACDAYEVAARLKPGGTKKR